MDGRTERRLFIGASVRSFVSSMEFDTACVVRSQFVRLVITERIATLDAVNIVLSRSLWKRLCVFETERVSLHVALDGLVNSATPVRNVHFCSYDFCY